MLITAKTNEGGDLITGKEKYFFFYILERAWDSSLQLYT